MEKAQNDAFCQCFVDRIQGRFPYYKLNEGLRQQWVMDDITKQCAEQAQRAAKLDFERNGYPDPSPKRKTPSSWVPFTVGIWDPVGIFSWVSPRTVAPLAVNILHGEDDVVIGVQVAAIHQNLKEWLVGFQIGSVNSFDGDIYGMQVGLFGNASDGDRKRGNVYGFQISGLVNNYGDCYGLCISAGWNNQVMANGIIIGGLLNTPHRDANGLMIALGANIVGSEIIRFATETSTGLTRIYTRAWAKGVQIALVNGTRNFAGVQIGPALNINDDKLKGLQLGLSNMSGTARGLQLGFFNYAKRVKGVQIGGINVAGDLEGVQIGAINIAIDNGLPFMLLLNAGW